MTVIKKNFKINKLPDGDNFKIKITWDNFVVETEELQHVPGGISIPTTYDPNKKIHTIQITDEALNDVVSFIQTQIQNK